jgi:hypothetical protein
MTDKKFISLYLVIVILGCVLLSPLYIFLKNSYEHQSFDKIVASQRKINGIYGTALNQNTFKYKMELAKFVKPDILALGSSRVMKFREEFFKGSFINTGGATNDLNEGRLFVNELLKHHKPKVVIFGVDFRWFNKNIPFTFKYPHHVNTGDILTFNKLVSKPIDFLRSGKIRKDVFTSIVKSNLHRSSNTIYKLMGLDSIINLAGYAPDGSRFDGMYLFNKKKSHDLKLSHTLNELHNGINTFTFGDESALAHTNILLEILETLKKNNIKVVFFLTPVSPLIAEEFDKNISNFGYITKLRKYLVTLGGLDYHDSREFVSDDCEFLDGYHGGDVYYQRLLLDMLKHNKFLNSYLDVDKMNMLIDKFSGSTISNVNNEIDSNLINDDVMELGCKPVHKR